MGKLITVWGAPGSGKTAFSVKLAEALYDRSRGKSAVVVVFTDIVTPTVPVIFPNFRSEDVYSVSSISLKNCTSRWRTQRQKSPHRFRLKQSLTRNASDLPNSMPS